MIEDMITIKEENGFDIVELPPLSDEQKNIINPIIPPTSGIRMEIYDEIEDELVMTVENQYMFLRVFKAVSLIAKQEIIKEDGQFPNILLVSDDRPSAPLLTEYCARILAYDKHNLFFQTTYDKELIEQSKGDDFYTRMGTPHASAALALDETIDVVIVLTASHNSIVWNGIKFYFNRPFPISGRVMKQVANVAINLEKIEMANVIKDITKINPDKQNNEYILNMISKIIDITPLKNKKIVFWPFLGTAPEIQTLLSDAGVDLIVIKEQVEPPNPTTVFDMEKVQKVLKEHDANIAFLMDADRDRIVFIIREKNSDNFITLNPNELYTAMHTLLVEKLGKTLINIRTIPSNPSADKQSSLNLISGVGFKHLGMVIFSAFGVEIDDETFQTGILYKKVGQDYIKLTSPSMIKQAITDSKISGKDIIMVAWEESGGHTFNIVNISDDGKIESQYPIVGDKYPAIAILVLSTLIEMGHDITKAINSSVLGTRTEIHAADKKKVQILSKFSKMAGETLTIRGNTYKINTFDQVNGEIKIIHLQSNTTFILDHLAQEKVLESTYMGQKILPKMKWSK